MRRIRSEIKYQIRHWADSSIGLALDTEGKVSVSNGIDIRPV